MSRQGEWREREEDMWGWGTGGKGVGESGVGG